MWMTGGEAIVSGLAASGVETVFGLPGAQIYGLFDAFHKQGLRVVGARHEQGCAYMAVGYAAATGRPGVYAVVPGPGMLNSAAGLVTALGRLPVLCLTGQVPTPFLGKGRGHLHELPDQLATLHTLTKWAAHAGTPGAAPALVAEAFRQMQSGRPGPVAIEMPWDQFTASAEVEPVAPLALLPTPEPDPDAILRAARALASAKAPMIFIGGGAFDAADEIVELAERLDAPIVSFRSGRGIVSDRHALAATVAAGYKLWPETDLVLGIGTRMEVPGWRWPPHPHPPVMARIEIDPVEIGRFPVDHAILADASVGTATLLAALARLGSNGSGRRERIAAAKAEAEIEIREIQPQLGYLDSIRAVLPDDGILVDDLSQTGFASIYGYPVYTPRSYISSGYQGTLGAGFPTALGVKVARPDKPVVSIAGDGGFMFAVGELATAVQYGINAVTIVFNNSAYGNVRRDQVENFGGRLVGADLVNPDFVALARSFGIEGARVASPDALRPVLEKMLAADAPGLIEVTIPRGSEVSPWRFLHPAPFTPVPPAGT